MSHRTRRAGTVAPVTDGPGDAEIEGLLVAADPARWQDLWDAVAALDAEPDHGRWAGGEVEGSVIRMPYVVYSQAVLGVLQAVFALGASRPFDWGAWSGITRYRSGRGLDEAPVAESVRMITAIVRADRFSEGTILASIDDGTLPAAIARLRRWWEENCP